MPQRKSKKQRRSSDRTKDPDSKSHAYGTTTINNEAFVIQGNVYFGDTATSGFASLHQGNTYVRNDLYRLHERVKNRDDLQDLDSEILRCLEDFERQNIAVLESLTSLYFRAGASLEGSSARNLKQYLRPEESIDLKLRSFLGDDYTTFVNLLGKLHVLLQTLQDHTSSWATTERRYGVADGRWYAPLRVPPEPTLKSLSDTEIIDQAMNTLQTAIAQTQDSIDLAKGLNRQRGEDDSDSESIASREEIRTQRRLHVTVLDSHHTLHGSTLALIDTGCTNCCISRAFCEKLSINYNALAEDDKTLHLADGRSLEAIGKVKLILRWYNMEGERQLYGGIYVYVVSDLDDAEMFLSDDFSRQPGVLDVAETWRVDDSLIRLDQFRFGRRRRSERGAEAAAQTAGGEANAAGEAERIAKEKAALFERYHQKTAAATTQTDGSSTATSRTDANTTGSGSGSSSKP